MVNYCEDHEIFQNIEYELQKENIPRHFFIIALYGIFMKLRSIFNPRYFLAAFAKLPDHINYLRASI